jgi:hypothetical protein
MRLCSKILCLALLLVVVVTACHDDTDNSLTRGLITLSETELETGHDGRYFIITAKAANGTALDLEQVQVHVDADWVALDADTLSSTGALSLYVNPNKGDRSRDAKVTFSLNGQEAATLPIHQRSEAEDDDNALSLTRKAFVGFGYNMLIDYNDPKSVVEQVIDSAKLIKAEETWGTILAEEGRARQSLALHASFSIEEMSEWMTKQSCTESSFLCINKSVHEFKSVSSYSLDQRTYGYSSLRKVVTTRYIDEGKLESIIRQGGYDVFTDDFRKLYNEVNNSPTKENVKKLVTTFGTHLVTYADLGGRLDYSVNFSSEETSRQTVERFMKYKNGAAEKSHEIEKASHNIVNNGDTLCFDIYGGSKDAKDALCKSSATKDLYGQVDASLLGAWLNSIDASKPDNISLVCCQLLPIWQLFTNIDARTAIINHILELARATGDDLTNRLQELGLDNYYTLPLTDDLLSFKNSTSATLVRLAYYNKQPKVEVCNEYVPQLRGDRRVTIVYPIRKNQTNICRGIFPGDGENAPAEVSFDSDGGCYVVPLDGYKPGDKLDSLYYIDGAFYTKDMGIKSLVVNPTIEDHYMTFWNGPIYPVVKIGFSYWTRQNMREEMAFGEPFDPDDPDGDYDSSEQVINNMLYANIFCSNSASFRESYPGLFDDETDALGYRLHWYVPRVADLTALQTFLGGHCKSLFAKQQSGFEAQFAGYYGSCDDMNGGRSFGDGEKLRYNGQQCFVAAKDNSNSGCVLVISPSYTLRQVDTNRERDNWYPVRPCRTSRYKYSNQ